MAGIWIDLFGTIKEYLRLGIAGVRLKNSGGHLSVRNTEDSADAEATMSKLNVSGQSIDLNSAAAGAGADWKYTIQRPTAGMTVALVFTLPPIDGSPGQVLATDGNGNLSFVSAGSTASSTKLDTTSLAFDAISPVTLFTTGAGDIIDAVEVIIDIPFNGTPSLSIGVAGSVSKYLAAVDLTAPAATTVKVHPGLPAAGIEALIATYTAGGATTGEARILVHFSNPS